jgi:acyl carrier protein
MSATLETLQRLIADKYDIDPATLDPDKAFADFGVDSLGLVELLFSVEDHFDIDLPQDRPLATLKDVAALVDEVLASKKS